jgi:hypothetical protein
MLRAAFGCRPIGGPSVENCAPSSAPKVLTSRQRQILDLVLVGHPSKNIAADLGISQRKRLLPPVPKDRARCRVCLPGDDERMSTFRVCSCQGRRLR